MSLKRPLAIAITALVIGGGGFAALAWRPAIAPISPPSADSFAPDQVARGAVLAAAGYCANCHTTKSGQPFGGGYAMRTAFGTIYSTNISPDPETGIGTWSRDAFRRALREGVGRDGAHLFPAFPYDHFTKMSDEDIDALYAYIMTRPAVHAPARANELPFPLGIRAFQAGWKLLFFRPSRFQPDPARDAQWNRGAYLAQGVSHCGACHTPRNPLGAEKTGAAFAGAPIDGWIAPPLTRDNPSPAPWSQEELFAYLHDGVSHYHGTAAGPMAPVARGLGQIPDSDVQAIATYFASIDGAAERGGKTQPAIALALTSDQKGAGQRYDAALRLYTAACAACHYNSTDEIGGGPSALRPELALNSALHLDDPTNLIRIILQGIDAKDGAPGVVMPSFANLSDADIARLAGYLRAARARMAPWPDLEKKVAAVRAEILTEK